MCPLSLDPLRIIQSVPFTHHTQTLCQLVPHAKQFVFSNANQKPAPVPCATCRGHSHFFRSFFISPFGANSRSARAHTSVSHSVGLHGFLSFFPTLAQGCFSFFNLWVLDWRLLAKHHFFSSCENEFLLVLWIHSPFFSKGHVSHQSSSHQIHSFLNASKRVHYSCTLYPFSNAFLAWWHQSASYVFQSLAVVSPPPSGAVWWVVSCGTSKKIVHVLNQNIV